MSKSALRHLLPAPVRARPRLLMALLAGCLAAGLVPSPFTWLTRSLLAWNVAVWLYLVLVGVMMVRADHHRLRRVAMAQDEGAHTVLAIVSLAAVISLVGSVMELSAAKVPQAAHTVPHVAFALVTVVGAWLLVPTMFALTYASVFYRAEQGHGLRFPEMDNGPEGDAFKPDYADFLYFAFTIAVASQTADVSVNNQPMRRLVLLQSLLAFAFNTTILAFTINIAASLF
jgi:uncharacterized membrane protein